MELHRYPKGRWLGLALGRFGWVFVLIFLAGAIALPAAVMDLRVGWATVHRVGEAHPGRGQSAREAGGPIVLRDLPENVARQEVEFGGTLRDGVARAVVAGLFLMIGSWFGVRVRQARRMVWLREKGVIRWAQVLGPPVKDPLLRSWHVEWRDEAGVSGRTLGRWRPQALAGLGGTLTVYADTEGRAPAVWEGDCGTR